MLGRPLLSLVHLKRNLTDLADDMPIEKNTTHFKTVSATHTSKPDDFSKQNSSTLPQLNQWSCDSAVCVCVQGNPAHTSLSSPKPERNTTSGRYGLWG